LIFLSIAALQGLHFVNSLRWAIIIRQYKYEIPLSALWKINIIGAFFNQFLPSGIGGDVFRSFYLKQITQSLVTAVESVLIDRLFGLIGTLLIIIIGVGYSYADLVSQTSNIIILVVLLLIIGTLVKYKSASKFALDLTKNRRYFNIGSVFSRIIQKYPNIFPSVDSVTSLTISRSSVLILVMLSVIGQFILGGVVFTLAHSCGSNIELLPILFIFPWVVLVTMLPISIGGWGVRETGMVAAFMVLNEPVNIALETSILFGICMLVSAVPGGLFWFTAHRNTVSDDQ
jgi:hypothetical protein